MSTYEVTSRTVEVSFTHPHSALRRMGPLNLAIKPDAIQWSYNLNTQSYPTYGGEVVQILSCNIGDMTISGTTRAYQTLERIYRWFLTYIQIATQGTDGSGSYDTRPVTFKYYERGWEFDIYPKVMPGFRYGRDVVAPTWTIQAAVAEPDRNYTNLLIDSLTRQYMEGEGIDLSGKATPNIGYNPTDPFTMPTTQVYNSKDTKDRDVYGAITDWFGSLIPAYAGGDLRDLIADYSRPAFGDTKPDPDTGSNPGVSEGKKVANKTRGN